MFYLRGLDGKCILIDTCDKHDTVQAFKMAVESKLGVPWEEQRIIFSGRQLEDEQTLDAYGVQPWCTLHLVLRLRGMISRFEASDAYLMTGEGELPVSDVTPEKAFTYTEKCPALGEKERFVLCLFLDHYTAQKPLRKCQDVKVIVPPNLLQQLFACVGEKECVQPLLELFKGKGACKVALRCTRGPSKGCIGWHHDGVYATHTTQVVLNAPHEYEGGRLCFMTTEGLKIPERVPGSMTSHSTNALHAVTALKRGVRKSLFVLDASNGLGDRDVFTLTQEQVDKFMREKWRSNKRLRT